MGKLSKAGGPPRCGRVSSSPCGARIQLMGGGRGGPLRLPVPEPGHRSPPAVTRGLGPEPAPSAALGLQLADHSSRGFSASTAVEQTPHRESLYTRPFCGVRFSGDPGNTPAAPAPASLLPDKHTLVPSWPSCHPSLRPSLTILCNLHCVSTPSLFSCGFSAQLSSPLTARRVHGDGFYIVRRPHNRRSCLGFGALLSPQDR